jgi:hypothetical protein
MKLSRTTRGSSAPPTNVSLRTASIRLAHATTTIQLRPRRRQPIRNTTPQPSLEESHDRLGSPFAFHPPRSRAGTPSTITSIAESLHIPVRQGRQGPCAYWLRSSRESEWEYRVNQLRTPADLRELIEYVHCTGDQLYIGRCHEILVQSLTTFTGDLQFGETLQRMDLATLVQHAENCGFWTASVQLGTQNQIGNGNDLMELIFRIRRSIYYPSSSNVASKFSLIASSRIGKKEKYIEITRL